MNISELLHRSELRMDILRIANDLHDDDQYSKDEAVKDLLKFLEKHNL